MVGLSIAFFIIYLICFMQVLAERENNDYSKALVITKRSLRSMRNKNEC